MIQTYNLKVNCHYKILDKYIKIKMNEMDFNLES